MYPFKAGLWLVMVLRFLAMVNLTSSLAFNFSVDWLNVTEIMDEFASSLDLIFQVPAH